LKDQDCGRLGKGGVVAKELSNSHPTNASTRIHSGNSLRELTINVGII
jgi:uncharacterized protein YwbE